MQDKETLISELGTAKKWQELVGFGRKENNAQPFVIELGLRVNKLQILRTDDCIEIKSREWLDKKNWREKDLDSHGYRMERIVVGLRNKV
jgi:hypothetical protein